MEKIEPQEAADQNWSEAVEDLLAAGDTEGAISVLETLVSDLETDSPSQMVHLQLSSALIQLSNLYSSKHFSLKSESLLSRASVIKQCALTSGVADDVKNFDENSASKCDFTSAQSDSIGVDVDNGNLEQSTKLPDASEDDWEAIADRAPDEFFSPQCLSSASNNLLEDTKVQTPKCRGRGQFSYKRNKLYSDDQSNISLVDGEDEDLCKHKERDTSTIYSKYGTRHVLVLSDFLPSTRTMELEKPFEDFRDRGVIIRWVNDTVALAVFRTPTIALDALKNIQFPFVVRILEEDDIIMSSLSTRDLEPPRQRPQTSARAAQRLIAQGMGLKLPSSTAGYQEMKTLEEARKNRIMARQKMKEDAWGDD